MSRRDVRRGEWLLALVGLGMLAYVVIVLVQ